MDNKAWAQGVAKKIKEKEIEVKYKYRVKNTVTPKNVTEKYES